MSKKSQELNDPGQWTVVRERDGQNVLAFLKEEANIGKGHFGAVKSVLVKIHNMPIQRLAMKSTSPGEEHLAYQEAEVLLRLDHPNIVLLKYYFEKEKNKLKILMELMGEGDLQHLIHHVWDPQVGLGIYCELFAFQIFRGLGYLHSLGIAHRDVKPANVLICRASGMAKLSDFNCSMDLTKSDDHSPRVGTKMFQAPELMLRSRHYDQRCDVWGAGLTFTCMIGKRPFFLIGRKEKPKDALPYIMEFLGTPTEEHFNQMKLSEEDRAQCPKVVKTKSIEEILGDAPGITSIQQLHLLIPHIFTYAIKNRYSAYEVCLHGIFDYIREGRALMDNGSRVPDVFQLPESSNMCSGTSSYKCSLK